MANAEQEDVLPLESILAERYRVLAPISSGAMGAVYRAHDSECSEDVALKRLTYRRHSERFDIEARLLAHLNHPRVVRVRDYFRDESGKYLIMDLVEGGDLGYVLMEKGRPGIPVEEAIEYVRQACEALQYVHDQQIVHRDVKPQNMIISKEGVVLVDFGVATEIDEEGGTVGIGTPRFMAPEVFAGGHVSPRADVFGLAATLWTLLVGKPPVYADPKPLSQRVPEVTPGWTPARPRSSRARRTTSASPGAAGAEPRSAAAPGGLPAWTGTRTGASPSRHRSPRSGSPGAWSS